MTSPTAIRDLFVSDVTRDIPPVVYFHEQSPDKLATEVSEYIITGGWPDDHPNHRRVPQGIHEAYVRLLTNICAELAKPGGPDLPTVWISGFYGSGKSSFAKLLGLALDGVALPDGTSLAEAWLRRDTSAKSKELRDAWHALRKKVTPLSVVFDIGSVARDNEHIHAAALRQVQKRLGYCDSEPLVADHELKLERDGEWPTFERKAQEVLGKPWSAVRDKRLAEDDFSLVLSKLYPELYTDPMSWFVSRAGTHARSESPEEAVAAIRDMLKFRSPESTLFLVVDEVSQYILSDKDRVDRLRAFATSLGAALRGKAWLIALGQQKLDEQADDSFLVWAKDRFPPKLQVHLATTNIRDVVHRRLLQKTGDGTTQLRALFERHRADLKLFAFGCEAVTPDEFAEVYPMLPGQIDLILQITSALRTRSLRAQGDDQAIRGLLQLLGELFRVQKLADMPIGCLITLDQIYEVQHTALESDVQASMARILGHGDVDDTMIRAAKAVALLELIQENTPTDARLVAQCLFDRVDAANNLPAVTDALEALRRHNLLSYSEKHGYKIQSSAGEEWERERRDMMAAREAVSEIVQSALNYLLSEPARPRIQGREFLWAGVFSDGRRADDTAILDPRDEAAMRVDFRFLSREERTDSDWIRKSGETALANRLVWVCGDTEQADHLARELLRSRAMVKKYKPRRESLSPTRKLLMQQEDNRTEELERLTRDAVAAAWMRGKMYFRGRGLDPKDQGASFSTAVHAAAMRVLPELFPHLIPTQVHPSELLQLLAKDLIGPPVKFLTGDLGILETDAGHFVPSCTGVVPTRILEHIELDGGLSGTTLLAHFGGPPFGYPAGVVKACVAGLLRGSKVRIKPEDATELTAFRDGGARDLFEKDRAFRRASIFPAGEDDIGVQSRARICKFFEQSLHNPLDREDHAIADAVANHFPGLAERLRAVHTSLSRLPGAPKGPAELDKLGVALEQCIRSYRQTKPTVKLLKKHLDTLRDGVETLKYYSAELTEKAIAAVNAAQSVLTYQAAQLEQQGVLATNVDAAVIRIKAHLASERPWREIDSLDQDLGEVRAAYAAERQRMLQWQEEKSEQARVRIKDREGFSTLTSDQSHKVLRPIALAQTDTTAEAIAPPLSALRDPFTVALKRAEDQANEILDELGKRVTVKVDLRLRHRELSSEADVNALVDEIRKRLLEPIAAGSRIRLL